MSQMQNSREVSICRICLEPVHNFICTDCLFDNTVKWVSMRAPEKKEFLGLMLKNKHESVKKMLAHDHNRVFCVSCKETVDEIACPCCYLYEMGAVIKSADREVARRFEKELNFDFVFHHGMSRLNLMESVHGRLMSSTSFTPVTITDKRMVTDMSMCENCEGESDSLAENDGRWLCDSCRDEDPVLY